MNYHLIRTNDMLNGEGLRVVLFVSGCVHHCSDCHNPETWDKTSGVPFTKESTEEILKELNYDYISGITLSGGDPLHEDNLDDILNLVKIVKNKYHDKTIWIYTGYTWEQINSLIKGIDKYSEEFNKNNRKRLDILKYCDVLCDGKFVKTLADINCPWVGSTNQRVIDLKKTFKEGNLYVKND